MREHRSLARIVPVRTEAMWGHERPQGGELRGLVLKGTWREGGKETVTMPGVQPHV